MATITLDVPDTTLSALRRAPSEMSAELRLAASLFWFAKGTLSQERAAELAGLSRTAFIEACHANEVSAVAVDFAEIERERKA